ncbi:MAG: AgmX/PglI C-terminal domain-containing protein [Myxococcota bacterium]
MRTFLTMLIGLGAIVGPLGCAGPSASSDAHPRSDAQDDLSPGPTPRFRLARYEAGSARWSSGGPVAANRTVRVAEEIRATQVSAAPSAARPSVAKTAHEPSTDSKLALAPLPQKPMPRPRKPAVAALAAPGPSAVSSKRPAPPLLAAAASEVEFASAHPLEAPKSRPVLAEPAVVQPVVPSTVPAEPIALTIVGRAPRSTRPRSTERPSRKVDPTPVIEPASETSAERRRVRKALLDSEVLSTLANSSFERLDVKTGPRRKGKKRRSSRRALARRGGSAGDSVAVKKLKANGEPDLALVRREVPVAGEGRPQRKAQIDQTVLRSVIRQSESQVHLCYLQALERDPEISGRIVADLQVSPEGTVRGTRIAESTVDHSGVESCVSRVIKTLVFPKDATPETTTVTYYWRFQPPAE